MDKKLIHPDSICNECKLVDTCNVPVDDLSWNKKNTPVRVCPEFEDNPKDKEIIDDVFLTLGLILEPYSKTIDRTFNIKK